MLRCARSEGYDSKQAGVCDLRDAAVTECNIKRMWCAAPEVLRSARSEGYDSKQADVWSSGVMLYAMLFCCYPFDRREDANDPRAFAKIMQRIFTGAPLPCPCRPFSRRCCKRCHGYLTRYRGCCVLAVLTRDAVQACVQTVICCKACLARSPQERPGICSQLAFVSCSNNGRCPGLMHVSNDMRLCCSGLRVPVE